MSESFDQDDVWKLLDTYFSHNHGGQLVKHLIDSYNDLVMRRIEQIMDGFNPIEVYHGYDAAIGTHKYVLTIEITNPTLTKPIIYEKDGQTKLMTPNDARTRGFTYSAPLLADVIFTAKTQGSSETTIEKKKFTGVNLGKLPIMVRSRYCLLGTLNHNMDIHDECRYDVGGYFIVNGNEKVVISHDRIAENKTYVFVNSKVSVYSHIADIRSMSEARYGMPKTLSIKYSAKPNQYGRYIRVGMQHVKVDIPLFVLFRALGVTSDKEIIAYCGCSEIEIAGCIFDGNHIYTRDAAMEYIIRNLNVPTYVTPLTESNPWVKMNALENMLKKDLLPHAGFDLKKKAMYLGSMVLKLIGCVSGRIPFDDRDSYINKRVDTPGVLIAGLFRQHYSKVIKDMKNLLHKEVNTGNWKASGKIVNILNKINIRKIIRSNIIESGLKYGLSTGNWGIKMPKSKQGVAQVLNRMTNSATLSHLRRITTPIEKSGKLVQPRKLHGTQWGIVCPAETPEGASVGLVKNLALMVTITIASSSEMIRILLKQHANVPRYPVIDQISDGHTSIIINGDFSAETLKPEFIYKLLKDLKRSGQINVYTSIAWNVLGKKIIISTEAGRCVRPLFIVHEHSRVNNIKGKIWNEAVLDGTIEYLDVEETSMALIAMRLSDIEKNPSMSYTHLEIDPSLILGVLAGSIPFSDHNQAPRNTYQSAMGKQAIGMYSTRYQDRYDTMSHVLNYPQRPLVYTRTGRLTNIDNMPCGINVIVAIATYTGFNQEDSIIMNQSSVERGMFTSTFYRTYKEQNNKNHSSGEEEYFCKPNPDTTKAMKPYNYSKLNDDGFVPKNAFVDSGDIIIGKCMGQRDSSVVLKGSERGFVDRNCHNDLYFNNTNGDGYTFAKVRIRGDRQPTIGDKFCVPAGHEVLTAQGWVVIEKITTDDFVAQLTVDGKVKYVNPTKLWSFDNDDQFLYQLEDSNLEPLLQCTSNHKLYAKSNLSCLSGPKWSLTEAEDLYGSVFWSMTSSNGLEHDVFLDSDDMCGVDILDKDPELRVLLTSAFIMNGVFECETRKIRLNLSCEQAVIIVSLLSKFSSGWSRDKNIITVDIPAVVDLFRQVQNEPKLPAFMMAETRSKLIRRALLDFFLVPTRRQISRSLADSIQHLALHADSLSIDVFCINFEHGLYSVGLSRTDGLTLTSCKQFPIACHKVYCIEVPTHVFCVRMGPGHCPIWTGNSSRHGQKGTVGILYRQEDMPFTKDGLVPDIIINPHAIPSRMTVAQLMECIMGKACVSLGTFGDATPFSKLTVNHLSDILQEHGMERHGNEIMYNSRTGEQLNTTVFIGPTFYQRLKHMVDDKIHSRAASGPVVMMTRQPAEGRARDGGLRLGEMEIECNWAHGTMQFLKERFMECSDNYRVHVCRRCGMMATANPDKNMYSCKACKNINHFAEVRIPYACKLFLQEVQVMNIGARFLLSSSNNITSKN